MQVQIALVPAVALFINMHRYQLRFHYITRRSKRKNAAKKIF